VDWTKVVVIGLAAVIGAVVVGRMIQDTQNERNLARSCAWGDQESCATLAGDEPEPDPNLKLPDQAYWDKVLKQN
jgi:hypothetical protein